MAVKFFGQFLVEKGVVSREELLKAMDLQERKNLKLGEMALKLGYISQSDILRAHNAQLSKDMRLGDLLKEMCILTTEQLNDVIMRQKNSHLYIGEALVLNNSLSSGELQRQLDAFKADQAEYVSDAVDLAILTENRETWEMAVDLTFKMITRILGLKFRIGKCCTVETVPSNFMIAAMEISGDVEGDYMLSVTGELQKVVARAMLREDNVDDEPAEVLEDTVMEFVNIICGNIAAKASQLGIILNINPPLTIIPPAAGIAVPEGFKAICFPIHVGEYEKMDLIIQIPK